jgi:hypothetical protein
MREKVQYLGRIAAPDREAAIALAMAVTSCAKK